MFELIWSRSHLRALDYLIFSRRFTMSAMCMVVIMWSSLGVCWHSSCASRRLSTKFDGATTTVSPTHRRTDPPKDESTPKTALIDAKRQTFQEQAKRR